MVLELLLVVASLVEEHGSRALTLVAASRGLGGCSSQTLEHRLNSCGPWAQLLHGTWDLSNSGTGPVSPALPGGLLTTKPPGKPSSFFFFFSRDSTLQGLPWCLCLPMQEIRV